MFHWDLPQPIQEAGGFNNQHIVTWFADYAKVLFDRFGDDVQYWMTFNEPRNTCQQGYGNGYFPPGLVSNGIGEYICAHHLLKAHAATWHLYNNEYRSRHNGTVGIVLDTPWFEPFTNSAEDVNATNNLLAFSVRFMNLIITLNIHY